MNPLDNEEFTNIVLDVIGRDSKMPMHTESLVSIPCSYSYFPKNLMEYSAKVNDRFLNEQLHLIEEIFYRQPKNKFANWFKEYQVRYFENYGSLAHDGFFRNPITPDLSDLRNIGANGLQEGQFIQFGHIKGGVLQTVSSTNSSPAYSANFVSAFPATGGTVNNWYNEIAVNVATSAGNVNFGVYSDLSSAPNNLLQSTGSIACPASSSYTYQSLTEFQITTTKVWLAVNGNNSSTAYNATTTTATRDYVANTFPTLPNPFGSPTTATDSEVQMKINHT